MDLDTDRMMQAVFDLHGPENERKLCAWWRCTEQPWRDIAGALKFKKLPTAGVR